MRGACNQDCSYLEMELAVDSLPLVIHHFKGVTSISIHVLITIRNSTITEQEAHLMGGLRTQCNEIPEHVRILTERKAFNVVGSVSSFCNIILSCALGKHGIFLILFQNAVTTLTYFQMSHRIPLLSVNEAGKLSIRKKRTMF